jgi:hypothetical protein
MNNTNFEELPHPSTCGHSWKYFLVLLFFIHCSSDLNRYILSRIVILYSDMSISNVRLCSVMIYQVYYMRLIVLGLKCDFVVGGPSLAGNSVVSGLVPSSPIISPGTVPLSAGAMQP